MTVRVVIVGAGGHGQVVADILLAGLALGGAIAPVGFVDDNPQLHGRSLLGIPVIGPLASLDGIAHDAVTVAIGDNAPRQALFALLAERDERFATACHPKAILTRDVQIGAGTMICAGAIVNTGSTVGANAILNTGCTVDHHNRIGDHVHVAPGAHLGGEVCVGEGALIGIGATVMPRCTIGEWCVVGAGACVTRSVPARATVSGIPARPHQRG